MNTTQTRIRSKRILSVLLALLLMLSVPTAFGAEIADSGTCGDNLTWALDHEGALTISGTGEMYNYTNSTAPWKNNDVKTVVIGSGVTSLGKYTFYDCSNLTAFLVDNNNPVYSSDAYGCLYSKDKTELLQYPIGNKRTSFTIPNKMEYINQNAFKNCTSLEILEIPSSVSLFSFDLFSDCSGLKHIKFQDGGFLRVYTSYKGCASLQTVAFFCEPIFEHDAFEGCTGLTDVFFANTGFWGTTASEIQKLEDRGVNIQGGMTEEAYQRFLQDGREPTHDDLIWDKIKKFFRDIFTRLRNGFDWLIGMFPSSMF